MAEQGSEEFVSEQMIPVAGTGDAAAMSRGEPGLPQRFTWRRTQYRLAGLISKWKTSGQCHSGSSEMYLRRHWYKILTDPPMLMTIYCDRQTKTTRRPKACWWVYTVERIESPDLLGPEDRGREGIRA